MTPFNKKNEKKQRCTSFSEDLENNDTPNKSKACKELLDEINLVKEGIKNSSPRKKLGDIVYNSVLLSNEISKRNYHDYIHGSKPGCSADFALDNPTNFKPKTLSFEVNETEGTKLEPVKKRWLREAYQDSSKWEYKSIQPINWDEDVPKTTEKRFEGNEILNSKLNPQYYQAISKFEGNDGEHYNSSILNGMFCNRVTKNELFKKTVGNISGEHINKDSIASQQLNDLTRLRKKSDSKIKKNSELNEIRPTVLMHSGQCKKSTVLIQGDREKNLSIVNSSSSSVEVFDNNNFKDFHNLNPKCHFSFPQVSIKRSVTSDLEPKPKSQKLQEDRDISTALLLMELSKYTSTSTA